MGKEDATQFEKGTPRALKRVDTSTGLISMKEVVADLAANWCSTIGMGLASQINEDGKIIVTKRINGSDTNYILSGFKNVKNPAVSVIRKMLEDNIISRSTKIDNFLIRKGCIWASLDFKSGTVNSGDCLLIILSAQTSEPVNALPLSNQAKKKMGQTRQNRKKKVKTLP